MDYKQAASFAEKVLGTELCRGADETESAQYFVSPVARAFIEGAIGCENTPAFFFGMKMNPDVLTKLGGFFVDVGEAFHVESERIRKNRQE